jgi:hypothetical protein
MKMTGASDDGRKQVMSVVAIMLTCRPALDTTRSLHPVLDPSMHHAAPLLHPTGSVSSTWSDNCEHMTLDVHEPCTHVLAANKYVSDHDMTKEGRPGPGSYELQQSVGKQVGGGGAGIHIG